MPVLGFRNKFDTGKILIICVLFLFKKLIRKNFNTKGMFVDGRRNNSLEEMLLRGRVFLHFIGLNEFHKREVRCTFSLIRENIELRVFFFRENVAEMKCYQTLLSHLLSDKQLSNVPK